MRSSVVAVVAVLTWAGVGAGGTARTQNALTISAVLTDRATPHTIGLQVLISGDVNRNAAIATRWRVAGTTAFRDGPMLFRVMPETVINWTVPEQRWIHFASSISTAYCAISIEEPTRLYCRDDRSCPEPWSCRAVRLLLPDVLDAPTAIDVVIHPEEGRGRMTTELRPAIATLAEEQVVVARIHQKDLAAALGATVTATETGLVAVLPYQVALPGPTAHAGGFDQTAVDYVATIRIGPSPTEIAYETREIARYEERCTYAHDHGGCYPPPPSCVRR